ncbi:MAG: aminotransferase class V-fold PLP-dependent enzyme [Wenzhouxiangellaceae bacterium]|nr:aminotransferase class V-fold PLP-dependent enzyme [Wenzhouxiangellaceae bacterium]
MNHAAISPWPAPVIAAMRRYVEQNAADGPVHYPEWLEIEQRLRDRAAALLNAESADIALLKNTSEGLSAIAAGLHWRPGDSMICCAGDFPSNRLPWLQLTPDTVKVNEVPFDDDNPEDGLIDALDASTRLMAVSSVRYDSGVRLDLARLGRACRDHGALLAVDAIQHLGALPLDVAELPVDFVVAGSHKWLLAPEGLAVFWSSAQARAQLAPVQTGWRMWPDMFNFARSDWSIPSEARRFEPGTLNMAGIHALDASLGLLLAEHPDVRATALLDRTTRLIDNLETLPGLEIITPREPGRRAGIVVFRVQGMSPAKILEQLAAEKIIAARRGDAVRLSPHFYTPIAQIDQTSDSIARMVRAFS